MTLKKEKNSQERSLRGKAEAIHEESERAFDYLNKSDISSLYSLLGVDIGREIQAWLDARVKRDGLNTDIVHHISSFRNELRKQLNAERDGEGRDIGALSEIYQNLGLINNNGEILNPNIFIAVHKAYLLLNQSSARLAEVLKSRPDMQSWAEALVKKLDANLTRDQIKEIFENKLSASIVFTAHPTAGIPGKYIEHIKSMAEAIQEVKERRELEASKENFRGFIESLDQKDPSILKLEKAIKDMANEPSYTETIISPEMESERFLVNVEPLFELIPEMAKTLENVLNKAKDRPIKINSDYLQIHSWVNRDIDGNPFVNASEHKKGLKKEQKFFGEAGAFGHTRQKNDVLSKLLSYCFEKNTKIDNAFLSKFILGDIKTSFSADEVKERIESDSKLGIKRKEKLLQTVEMLEVSKLGAIRRLIISFNQSFADMLVALALTKVFTNFNLQIVPLTEQVSDLKASADLTIEALSNSAWRKYLISQKGQFVKMRGPSDSGKQNGFVPAQWEMFKSKHLDGIVVRIFNDYLKAFLHGDKENLRSWQELDAADAIEMLVVKKALKSFDKDLKPALEDNESELWLNAFKENNLYEIEMVNFDGWGEPIERGGGLDFDSTVRNTQPEGSAVKYERTSQGGGTTGFAYKPLAERYIQDFIDGNLDIAIDSANFDLAFKSADLDKKKDLIKSKLFLNIEFCKAMDSLSETLRGALRKEVFGFKLNDNELVDKAHEKELRAYFSHVIKSPLIFLDFFNIASRPTSRSGSRIAELLRQYDNDVDKFVSDLPVLEIVNILDDIRAIPYAAMFSLLGANHVPYYGFTNIINENPELISKLRNFYQNDIGVETRLTRHMIDTLERGLMAVDMESYAASNEIIEKSTGAYDPDEDQLLAKFKLCVKDALRAIAAIKYLKSEIPETVNYFDMMHASKNPNWINFNKPQERELGDLFRARRNDAVVPRIGLSKVIAEIFRKSKAAGQNPADFLNSNDELLVLMRTLLSVCSSNGGTGCTDAN